MKMRDLQRKLNSTFVEAWQDEDVPLGVMVCARKTAAGEVDVIILSNDLVAKEVNGIVDGVLHGVAAFELRRELDDEERVAEFLNENSS